MVRILFLFFVIPLISSCTIGLDIHKTYESGYIVMAHSIDITKNKKKGKACSVTKESNQDMVFEAARLGGLKKEIVFIEKIVENNQFCTVVYGE